MPGSPHPRLRRALLLTAILAMAAMTGEVAERPFGGDRVERLTQPYGFALIAWEVEHLAAEWPRLLASLLRPSRYDEAQARETLSRYFALAAEVRRAEAETERASAYGGLGNSASAADADLARLQRQLRAQEDAAERALGQALGQLLAEEGLSAPLRLPTGVRPPFPPVSFEFESPPKLLVLSPRERIEVSASYLLRPNLTPAETDALEKAAEAQGPSALVVPLGGLATYPSIVEEAASPRGALSDIAHEWVHQYLFFYPLGRGYGSSYEMRTVNETVAGLVGDELGATLVERLGLTPEPASNVEATPSGFDFSAVMRETRRQVDELLAQGRVGEAEAYMRERQRFLAENGYYIRKLNQAYFAFHGSYADSPTSVSPIGDELRQLRARSSSVGDFLRQVQGLQSYQGLQARLGGLGPPR